MLACRAWSAPAEVARIVTGSGRITSGGTSPLRVATAGDADHGPR